MYYKSMYGTLRIFTKFSLDNTCNTRMIALKKNNKLPPTKKRDLAQDVYDLQTLKEAHIKHAMGILFLVIQSQNFLKTFAIIHSQNFSMQWNSNTIHVLQKISTVS